MAAGRPVTAALAAVLSAALLAGCSSGAGNARLEHAADYAAHPHLRVTGYPVPETLGLVQQVVWRLADGSADRLVKLAAAEGPADARRAAAEEWIRTYGADAAGEVSADFGDDPANRQTVRLTFHGSGRVKELTLRPDDSDGSGSDSDGGAWRVLLR
ncbi:hypothetical protein [Streptomyces sp. NRRL S-495]|uniref:hypothetical protein n=1 Tax=Streptomyces sp. NRRL S-495 TaxID=1609133 RepID=UPI0005F8D4A7|nr:hypothetical protein [Streptomyces sp. NRRL S-495]KJY31933.1 hypothetical protein VR45_23735 [Streptomyces sp. NRRL S-495]